VCGGHEGFPFAFVRCMSGITETFLDGEVQITVPLGNCLSCQPQNVFG